jgi:hypothetical protein
MLVRAGEPAVALERLQLGGADHEGDQREAFLQNLVHEHPEIIPMADIEPAFMPLIPICRELQTAAGYVDNLWLTPEGGIVLGECKLFRNQQARREVIVQALDYARAVAKLRYDEFESAVQKALRSPSASLWDLVRDRSELDRAQFEDSVQRRPKQGRFMILIIGDGIQEGVEAFAGYLQLHAGLHVGLALVDLSIWRDVDGRLLVLPRIPLRTVLIERGIVVIDASGAPQVLPPRDQVLGRTTTEPRAYTVSEPEFFDQLEQRRPGLADLTRSFLADVADLGIVPEFRKSLILRWGASPDFSASPGYIDTSGRVWLSSGWNTANKLGNPAAGERYLASVAAIVHGEVKRYEKNWPDVVGADGHGIDAYDLLKVVDRRNAWKAAISQLISETRPSE